MLLTLGLLVAGVWVWSGWRELYWETGARDWTQKTLSAENGEGWIFSSAPWRFVGSRNSLAAEAAQTPCSWHLWTWSLQGLKDGGFCFVGPLWLFPLLLWTPAALLLRSGLLARRRALTGSCPACGYDRRGLAPGAVCPECGKV